MPVRDEEVEARPALLRHVKRLRGHVPVNGLAEERRPLRTGEERRDVVFDLDVGLGAGRDDGERRDERNDLPHGFCLRLVIEP